MLSHEDRRRIAAIERQLWNDDPKFARRFSRRCAVRKAPWRRPGTRAVTLGILYLLAVVAGLLTQSWAVLVVCALLTVVAGCAYARIIRRRTDG